MPPKRVRVLVVDDSAFMRRVISDILGQDPEVAVVGTCGDGAEAVRRADELRPDVITMDIRMPGMDGLTALSHIMDTCPTPVLMVSGIAKEDADVTVRSFEHGAVDFVVKPGGPVSLDMHKIRDELLAKVKMAATAKVQRRSPVDPTIPPVAPAPAGVRPEPVPAAPAAATPARAVPGQAGGLGLRVAVLGASTGGPQAITEILGLLPKDVNLAVLVVQHMPVHSTRSFAEGVGRLTGFDTREAVDGDQVVPGRALVAPGDFHMTVHPESDPGGTRYVVRLNQQERVHGVRPSIDILMTTAAAALGRRSIGVILTGMGKDGAAGMAAIRKAGGFTMVQDEPSSIVYGMPRATLEHVPVDLVGPVDLIAARIREAASYGV